MNAQIWILAVAVIIVGTCLGSTAVANDPRRTGAADRPETAADPLGGVTRSQVERDRHRAELPSGTNRPNPDATEASQSHLDR